MEARQSPSSSTRAEELRERAWPDGDELLELELDRGAIVSIAPFAVADFEEAVVGLKSGSACGKEGGGGGEAAERTEDEEAACPLESCCCRKD
jgi:hypothetical protein